MTVCTAHRPLLLGDEGGEALAARPDVVQDVLDAAAGAHRQRADLVVELSRVGVNILVDILNNMTSV